MDRIEYEKLKQEIDRFITVGDISKYKNETYLCLEYFMEVVQNVTF